jgi:hypothetical protein
MKGGRMNTKEEFKNELKNLYKNGVGILSNEAALNDARKKGSKTRKKTPAVSNEIPSIQLSYNTWYTASLRLIKLLIPERLKDFVCYYKLEKRKENYFNTFEYTISDYLNNSHEFMKGFDSFDEFDTFSIKFRNQLAILNSCIENIDTILFDIENILQYNMYKSELEAAADLLSKNFIRPAGALAGVILEGYLKSTCKKHNLIFTKKRLTISDCNEKLKTENIIDVVLWRKIQYLADIRNICDHKDEREPKKEEVHDFIADIEKIIVMII